MLENYNQDSTQKLKSILIKLGSKCNLKCKYCHQHEIVYDFDENIINFINKCENLEKITFSGGEPLLFISEIDKIINSLNNKNIKLHFVTNGTLLNNKTVKWINDNNIVVGISFDGFKNLRGGKINFQALQNIKNFSGISSVVTNRFNFHEFINDIAFLMNRYKFNLVSIPNFVHQTKGSPNLDLVDKETIDKYIEFICYELEFEYDYYKNSNTDLKVFPYLYRYVTQFLRKDLKDVRGVKCCNEYTVAMTTQGDFMLCGYGEEKIGDIYAGIDWGKVESYIPDRCKKCELWDMCHNGCIANITENECYIYKNIYKKFKELESVYGRIEGSNEAE